jgi:hypothetical protein
MHGGIIQASHTCGSDALHSVLIDGLVHGEVVFAILVRRRLYMRKILDKAGGYLSVVLVVIGNSFVGPCGRCFRAVEGHDVMVSSGRDTYVARRCRQIPWVPVATRHFCTSGSSRSCAELCDGQIAAVHFG